MRSPNADRPGAPPVPRRNKRRRKGGRLFVERLFAAIPIHPFLTAAVFAATTILLVTIVEVATGRMDDILTPDDFDPYGYFILLLHILFLAYIPAAVAVLIRSARKNVAMMASLVEPSDIARAKLARVGTYSRWGYWTAGLVGIAILIAAPALDSRVWQDHLYSPYNFALYTPEVWAHRITSYIFGFYGMVLLFVATVEARRFNWLAAHVKRSVVLDAQVLDPFARLGLTNVMIIAVMPAILSLFLFGEGYLYLFVGIALINFVAAIFGMIWPILGIHRQIKLAKQERLAWVNGELAKERDAIAGGGGGRFPELMAYRTYIDQVREWPLDGSTLTRLLLYIGIPAVSWSGAALVERMIDAALG